MDLSMALGKCVVSKAITYLGRPYDWHTFDCVHFVRQVYRDVGIILPRLNSFDFPPSDFHLSAEVFNTMPIGHSVFLRRKTSKLRRSWTHIGIIVSASELIHCSRNFGNKVIITPRTELLETYDLATQAAR